MTQKTQIEAGEVVAFSSGEYSDYGISGFSKVLKPLNKTVWDEMVAACTAPPDYDPDDDPRFHDDRVMPWLVKNGYIEEIEYTELHLGAYRRAPAWENA
jgi:hypothetical protein